MSVGDVIALVVGIVAAAISVGSVVVAMRANRSADLANVAASEANRIAEEALALQKRTAPPPWSGAQAGAGTRVSFRNESGRSILVVGVDAVPEESEGMVSILEELPSRVEYGDSFDLNVARAWGASPNVLILEWRFEDDDDYQRTERRLF